MKHVQLIRQHASSYVVRLRSFISMTEGNTDVVDRLRGDEGEKRAARIVAYILQELGHDGEEFNRRSKGEGTSVEDSSSTVRRSVRGVRGPKGEPKKRKERIEQEKTA